jgi:hypothetical protein
MTITVTTDGSVQAMSAIGPAPFPVQVTGGTLGEIPGEDPGGLNGWGADLDAGGVTGMLVGEVPPGSNSDNLWNAALETGGSLVVNKPSYLPSDAEDLWNEFVALIETAQQAGVDYEKYEEEKQAIADARAALDDDDDTGEAALNAREDANEMLFDEIEAQLGQFEDLATDFGTSYKSYAASHVTNDGSHGDRLVNPTTIDHRFNLNEYLPESEKIKVSFWKVYPRRM